MNPATLIGTFLVCAMLPYSAQSEPKSSIVFYDTTGQNPTGTIGWRGTATEGHLFVETPSANGPLEVKNGNLTVNGAVEAQSLRGDGSGVTNVPVEDGSVTTSKIAEGAITTAKLDNGAVTGAKISSGAINNGKLAQNAVRGKNLNDTCVATAHIKDGAVTDAKIGSVSWEKVSNKPEIPGGTVGDGTITTAKLVDGAVTNAKVASVTWDKISDPPAIGAGDITGVSAGTGLSGGGTMVRSALK